MIRHLLILLSVLVTHSALLGADAQPVFRRLSPDALVHLDKQRTFVREFVAQHFPKEKLTRSKADFALLQKIVDAKIISKNETWKLQSLGIVFGDALAATIEGLAWWEVTDEYGTDPTLRYRTTSLQFNALTMISKRVEDGKEVNIPDMAAWLEEFVRTRGREFEEKPDQQ
jgi:hypothetical protein